uniref:NudC domain-containing protein 1 n=1 Tax=Gadus morhua TaxID=8049 RepID=A0A8C5FCR9_GADMO
MSSPNYSLKVNRELLDPNFESYRLSLDPIPSYNVELDAAVEEVKLKETQYTLDHVRAFGMYNYLHLDPWYPDSVFFVDCKGRVLNLTVTLDTALGKPKEVFRLSPDGGCEEPLCPSLSLPSASWAALSDGTGRLYLLRTSQRGENSHLQWEPQFNQQMGEPFVILHSLAHVQGGVHSLEVLLLRVQKDPQESKGSGFSVTLEWITVAAQDQGKRYEVRTRRLLTGKSVPHYAALEPQGRGLMVASEKPFACTHLDGKAVETPADGAPEVGAADPLYFWQQTAEDVTVSVRMPEGFSKDQVQFRLAGGSLSVGVQGFAPILEGALHAAVDPEASAWVIKDNKSLEVTLQKLEEGSTWPELVPGDGRGEYMVSEEQAALIHERLTYLTVDDLVNLGSHQYLFTVDADPSEMPCLCLRHDVDALVWQPRPAQPDAMWEHIATFNALGYVQASKRDKKFSTCAPDFSYAALGECLRRTFIYRQPAPVDTVLFNRKQGRQVGQVAKQQVASLDSADPVLGFRASNERLFVLTEKNLFVLKVNNN